MEKRKQMVLEVKAAYKAERKAHIDRTEKPTQTNWRYWLETYTSLAEITKRIFDQGHGVCFDCLENPKAASCFLCNKDILFSFEKP